MIQVATTQLLRAADLTATRVLEEYRQVAFVDARSFCDDDWKLKPFSQLTAEQGSAIAGFEAIIKNAAAGDGITDAIHKLRLCDKLRALEGLGKYFGLFAEKIDLNGELTIKWQDPD